MMLLYQFHFLTPLKSLFPLCCPIGFHEAVSTLQRLLQDGVPGGAGAVVFRQGTVGLYES